jgi:hypothetical protein
LDQATGEQPSWKESLMSRSVNERYFVLSAMVLSLSLFGAGCNKGQSKGDETASRVQQASGEMVQKGEMTAVVESVDRVNRTVTLREPEGNLVTVDVGQGVALERMEPEDKVNVAYQESLAFQLQEPGAAPTMEQESTSERLPEGVQFGRRVTTTVEILAVAPKGAAATFRNQEGDVRTVEVDNPENQEKVSHLRPGDSVEVTYTEKLAVQLEK